MSTATILPPTSRLDIETADLSLEIFADTYAADWATADALAAALVDDLLTYAAEWDCEALAAGNAAAECSF